MKYLKIVVAMVFAICSNSNNIKAQTMNAIYDLRNAREMATGFEFKEDGSFYFYLAYCGLDRNATGTYTVENDTIKLKSDKVPAKDFEVASRKSENDFKGFVIKVDDENKFIVSYVKAVALINGQMHSYDVSSDGIVRIDTNACEKIFLWNQLYGDIMT